jgi:NAD(P)-dependent dehydrogenase (short-subunit alcohol dehydrogenase family)
MSGFFSLAGKVAVVTGGSSGIGASIVARFRAAGGVVVIADRLSPATETRILSGSTSRAKKRFRRRSTRWSRSTANSISS